MDNAYALIMAGGAGTRLWPLSRQSRPKPLLHLVEEDRSMFRLSVERLAPLFPLERVLIVTGEDLAPMLREQVPALPAENFIVEPMGRDTAPAIGLGAIHIRHRDPTAIVAVLTADHYIHDLEKFRHVLSVACQIAAQNLIVTLGISPSWPATGFGYIERGEFDQAIEEINVYKLKRFTEKPDATTAEQFLASGQYSWNSGMFVWTARRVVEEIQRYAPDLYDNLERLAKEVGRLDYHALLNELWPDVERISVDYALMEHIREGVRVIPVEMGWSDVGNFSALYDILSEDDGGNVISGPTPLTIETRGSLIFSKRLVATIGLEDVIIVDTDDALLVCRRDRAQDVKEVVDLLKKEHRSRHL